MAKHNFETPVAFLSTIFFCIALLAGIFYAGTVSAADLHSTHSYTNPAYGFSIQFPRKLKICTTPAPGPNHGFVALLRSDSCSDGIFEKKPHLELFVRYDVTTMANAATELADELCENKTAHVSKLRRAGLPVYVCPAVKVGSMCRWRYFFLRSQLNSAGQIYTLDLYSSKKYAMQDQALQRQLLQQLYFTSKG